MKYRKLRIAWSVVWGVAAAYVTLCWVMSYRADEVKDIWGINIIYHSGTIAIGIPGKPPQVTIPYYLVLHDASGNAYDVQLAFRKLVKIRFWWLVTVMCALAIVPWLSWRFSLRTLLIAMTLIAVGLGFAMWLRA